MDFRRTLMLSAAVAGLQGLAVAAHAQATPPAPQTSSSAPPTPSNSSAIQTVTVVAERRAENLQRVPIAVTALSGKDLQIQRIDNGSNLASTVPNMSFQPGLFGKPDFSIRGIGYQLVTTTGDAGVAVHENDGPISSPRIAQADFFDVQQVEVLRGPQGTLYGRNATGGVVNVITAKPTSTYSAALTLQGGNYNTFRANGYVNAPLGDMFSLRVAGDYATHSGYQYNVFNGDHVDGENIWSGRATLAFHPNSKFDAYLMYEHFGEHDSGGGNEGVGTNACITDNGPTQIGGVAVTNPVVRNLLSFGCSLNTNIYAPHAVGGVLNGVGTFGNRLAYTSGLANGSLFANNPSLTSPYDVDLDQNPFNNTTNDLGQFSANWNVTDSLKLSSLTTYDRDASQYGDGGLRSKIPFNTIPFFFGGSITDPQINGGQPLSYYTSAGYVTLFTEEYSEELRLQSSFSGPINFSVGGLYMHVHKYDNVFVFDNFNSWLGTTLLGATLDPRPETSAYGGHEYYESVNPYQLNSEAVFGELYWQATPDIKFTAGIRYTSDRKEFYNNNSAGNLLTPGSGIAYLAPQKATFNEPTGRINVDWTPKLPFTDDTLVYASYSRGYKGGGFNPPNLSALGVPLTYAPEFVNAYEIGTKNLLLDRTMTLNLTGFYYDYTGYQFTQAAAFGTLTSNVNAKIWGVEFESQWKPVPDMTLNAAVGYLNTRIQGGPTAFSINQDNPTAGNPNLFAVKDLTNYCIVNTANFAHLVSDIQSGAVSPLAVNTVCNGTPSAPTALDSTYNLFSGVTNATFAGVPVSIAGNRLPNVPDWTASVGGQYDFHINDEWTLTPRFDVRYTGGQFSDLFNNPNLYVKPYAFLNLTLTLVQAGGGFSVQAYAVNIGANNTIIGAAAGGGAITGDEAAVVIANPTTYGISVTKRF